MKKHLLLVCLLVLAIMPAWAQQAKYVFYFIGDGMGVNQVNGTEAYRAELEGRIGTTPLLFASFPYGTMVTTYSGTNGVTDSAASGTALATGIKTKNGVIGMQADQQTPVSSVAVKAKEAGMRVGIATSVSVDHATPASFYAHVPDRNNYYDIGKDLPRTGFDFYAGSDFLNPVNNKAKEEGTLYEQCEKAGYTIARGYKDYRKKSKLASKMILFQSEEASRRDRNSIPYAIDREKNDLALADITRAGINFLSKDNDKGFFLMVEGGKIDWACHANDMCFIPEVLDMDNAIKVAYEFYQQHPDETLIVVSADHETGGLALGRGAYELHLEVVGHQRMSIGKLGQELHALHEKHGDKYNWDVVKAFLTENFGFWNSVKLKDVQTKRLEKAFENIMAGKGKDSKSLYQKDDELATTVRQIQAECAMAGWQSGGHSNGYVPCFAIGAGAEMFTGRIDNTEIPKRIAKAAGWQIK